MVLPAGTWARNQLFLVTPSAVVLVFAAAGGGSGRIVGLGGTADPFVEVIRQQDANRWSLVWNNFDIAVGQVTLLPAWGPHLKSGD